MIDWSQVRQLKEDVGHDEIDEVIDLFLMEVSEAIETLQSGGETATPNDLSAQYHFLKGCAFNLGFTDFGQLCSDLEVSSKSGAVGEDDISQVVVNYEASKKVFLGGKATELT